MIGQNKQSAIVSGVPWFDQNGNTVSARGAGIIREGDRFYLFGELKSDTANAFAGFACYSSADLYHWKFERLALPVQDGGRLGPNRVGERPKVLKCPATGEFVMLMHTDDLGYKDPCVGYATSKTVDGEYTFQGPLLFNGELIRKWDIGAFQDTDGSGYLITHSGNLFRLSDDYTSVTEQVLANMTPHCESPVIFRKDSLYYWIGSELTSWERNDNYYFTARSLRGPWISRGYIAPEGKLTWNSQSTAVIPVCGTADTTFLFMGDRWAFPRQQSAATYVWQPLNVEGSSLSMPVFEQSWTLDLETGKWEVMEIEGEAVGCASSQVRTDGTWIAVAPADGSGEIICSKEAGSNLQFDFDGSQVALYGQSSPEGGYAEVEIREQAGKVCLKSTLDFYCKYTERSIKFLSPVLQHGRYQFRLTIMGDHGNWYKKDGTKFGSSGNWVTIEKLRVIQ